jgi:hypothetical protein
VCEVISKHTFSNTIFTKSTDMESESKNNWLNKSGRVYSNGVYIFS